MQGTDDDAFELLSALETQTPETVRQLRDSTRMPFRSYARIEASDPLDGTAYDDVAVGDISKTGCRVLLRVPLHLGAVYTIAIEGDPFELGTIYAQCVRGRFVREHAFEMGMRFFSPIELDEAKPPTADDDEDDLL